MNKFLLGWSIAMTLITIFCVYLLYKKPSTHNEIENLKQKNKRNKGSDIDNEISAKLTDNKETTRKKRRKLFNKNKDL